jgi:hypothetical protein
MAEPFQGGSREWGMAEPHGCNPRPDPLLPTHHSLLPPLGLLGCFGWGQVDIVLGE